MTEKYS